MSPLAEAQAQVRRAALLLVLASAIVAGLASTGLVLFRLFETLQGTELAPSAIAELGFPIGILVTAVALGLYHGTLVRRDIALTAQRAPATGTVEDAAPVGAIPATTEQSWESEGGAVMPEGIALTLRGPDGPDMDAALEAARRGLPEGYRLERD
jgi:hypothetical protein